MPAEPTPTNGSAKRSLCSSGRAAIICLVLGAAVLLGGVLQEQFGIFGRREWPLPPASKIRVDGKAFKTKLPAWARGATAETRVELLRNGKAVGQRVSHHKTVVEGGGGAFKIQRDQIYFSLPRNDDPRPGIRALALSLPRPVRPVLWVVGGAWVLLGGLMALRNPRAVKQLAAAGDRIASIPGGALIGGVFAAALVVTLARLPDAMTYSDGCFSVKGVPYTDATGWDELATNLSEGRGFTGGFSAQRPLYPVMLGLLYTMTGQSLLAAKILEAFWLALAVAAVCALGAACGSRIAGLAAALGVLVGEDEVYFSEVLLTETSGLVFGVAAVLALVVAIERPAAWRIALAALLLACANLASGFGLFALLGYGAVALVTWWMRQGMRRALWQSLLLAGVVALAWMPWLLRQHAVHGIWNLSTSSANLMYAAAAPEHGRLGVEAASEWRAAGVPDEEGARYKFYMRKYAEAVKAQPAAYARTVVRGAKAFADFWIFRGPGRFGVVLLGLIGAALALLFRQPKVSALAGAAAIIALLFELEGRNARIVWPVAASLTLLTCPRGQRPFWALVAVTAPLVALLAGMTGGNLGRRMWTACDWTMPLLLVMGGAGAMRVVAGAIDRLAARIAPRGLKPAAFDPHLQGATGATDAAGMRMVATVIGGLLLTHAVLGSVVSTGLHLVRGSGSRPTIVLPPDANLQAHQRAVTQHEFLKAVPATDPRFWVEVCQFGEYVCHLNAWDDEHHWARSFEVRPYDRAVGFARLSGAGGSIACQMRVSPEEIPRDVPLMLVGIRNVDPAAHLGHDVTMIEVLGWVPLEVSTSTVEPQWQRARWLPSSSEALEIVQGRR